MNIDEVRKKYPQYSDISDSELADKLHSKFYSNVDKNVFYKKIGLEKTGLIKSAGAGVISGLGKATEGITTLGTTLVDLGLNTQLTEKVEKAFDDNDFLSGMEDLADDRWTGSVTEILTQLGVPGGIALKGANALVKAKNLGTLGRTAKMLPTTTRMAAVGGAELAAATEDLGTVGDAMGFGITQTRENQGESGRRDAIRKLENRFKFGLEGALGFGLFEKALMPAIKFSFSKAVPALKGVLTRSTGSADEVVRMVDEIDPVTKLPTGRKVAETLKLEQGFQFNKNNILRAFDKHVLAKLRPRGDDTVMGSNAKRKMIGEQRASLSEASYIVRSLEQSVQKLVRPLGGKLDDVEIKQREEIMENIYDYLTAPKNAKDATKVPKELLEQVNEVRSYVDNLSGKLKENPLAIAASDSFVRTVAANVGEYLTRSYRTIGSETKKDWFDKLYNTDKGKEIIEKAKIFLAEKDPSAYGGTVIGTGKNRRFVPGSSAQGKAMDAEIKAIVEAGEMSDLGNELVRLKAVDAEVFKARQQVPKEIRELLGEIKDPSVQLLETSTKINNFLSSSKYYQKLADDGLDKYFFNKSTLSQGGQNFTTQIKTDLWNPLNGKYTTPEIATNIERLSSISQKPGMLSNFYNGFLLAPKAIIQESKTTLSPITHFRNVSSALFFSGINGNLFNPSRFISQAKESYKITKSIVKGELETQAGRKLFKTDSEYKQALKDYMEMQRLGIVNTSARLGDLKNLIDDMTTGIENISSEGTMFNVLKRFNEKTGLKRLREGARTLYSAEDDFYKIQNYFAEQSKYRTAFNKAYKTSPTNFARQYGDEARDKYGLTDLTDEAQYNQFIKEEAADIVRNNIPNYDYVSPFIKELRKAPLGNFISFPAEILRTGINTITRGAKEIGDKNLRSIGRQRLLGVGLFGIGSGKIVEETAQFMTGVSNETLNSLREYLPEWSKNSTLIPIKQGNQIYYIDYSHSNAYDYLTRPLRAAMNGFNDGFANEQGALQAIESAAFEASKELLQPFLSESIISAFYGDVLIRGGQTRDGVRIWNPTDSTGDKVFKTMAELVKRAAPGSVNQLYRTYLSGVGSVQKYNRGYKPINEGLGILGFRIQDPFIEQGIQFKMSDNKKNSENSIGYFNTIARDGNSTPQEIAKAYQEANERKKKGDKILFKQLKAAENLGLSKPFIIKKLGERFSKTETGRIINNKAVPFKVSDFIKRQIMNNASIRNQPNPLPLINRLTSGIFVNFATQDLFENPDSLFDRPLEIDLREEDRTPNVVTPSFSGAYGAGNLAIPEVPLSMTVPSTGTISQTDRSQLAKSGDIDITEALVNRG